MAKKVWIDTDTGSDDAVALVMMLRDPSVEVVGISTVAGNVGLEQATKNALMTIGYAAAAQPPVYPGCERPLFHEHRSAVAVHGEDGMGDLGALQPGGQPASEKGGDRPAGRRRGGRPGDPRPRPPDQFGPCHDAGPGHDEAGGPHHPHGRRL